MTLLDQLDALAEHFTLNANGEIALTTMNIDGMMCLYKMLPQIRKRLLAAEQLAKDVEGMDCDFYNYEYLSEKRDAALSAYREAIK